MGGQVYPVVNKNKRTRAKDVRSLTFTPRAVQPQEPYWKRSSSYSSPEYTSQAADMRVASLWARAFENIFLQQSILWRELELRLRHLENTNRRPSADAAFERATWWMLWGILMLILGSTLIVVLVLVVQSR